MSGRFRPVCAEVMQRDAILADRMWSAVVGLTQDEPADLELKAEARRLCMACPIRMQCVTSGLPVGTTRDDPTILGGLDARQRYHLQRIVARALGAPDDLRGVGRLRIQEWLTRHPEAIDEAIESRREYMRSIKHRHRSVVDRRRTEYRLGLAERECGLRDLVQGELDLFPMKRRTDIH